jgi:hypothetical protein
LNTYTAAVQANGKIVTAGGILQNSQYKLFLFRHNVDGSLDAGFGSNGISTQLVTGNDEILGLAIQTDGMIVAAGKAATPTDRIVVTRFHGDPPTNAVFADGFEQP